jgi:cellulose biosynthesis protein BcsQ
MINRAPDDIFALYSRFDLDGDDYRVFAKAPIAMTPSAEDEPDVEDAGCELRTDLGASEDGSERNVNENIEAGPIPFPLQKAQVSQRSLRNLGRQLDSRPANRKWDSQSLANVSVQVCGAAGGVGVTTVAATFAKIAAENKRRSILLDNAQQSTLPLFFNAYRPLPNQRRFAGIYTLFEPPIRILQSQLLADRESDTTGSQLMDRLLAEVGGHLDYLVLDEPKRSMIHLKAAVTVYVATPDISSMLGASRLRAESTGDTSSVWILNRFDCKNELHNELLAWFSRNFNEVITVRESGLVAEALAEGCTILDWRPNAEVAGDFQHVFAAVSAKLNSDTKVLSLCS